MSKKKFSSTLLIGPPCSGKTVLARTLGSKTVLSLESCSCSIDQLVSHYDNHIQNQDKTLVVVEGCFPTRALRSKFTNIAKARGIPVTCLWLDSSAEECAYNVCTVMAREYGTIYNITDFKRTMPSRNTMPIGVIERYFDRFEIPIPQEGFSSIEKVKFNREWGGNNSKRGVILNGNVLYKSKGQYPFPLNVDEIEILPNRAEVLQRYLKEDYKLAALDNLPSFGEAVSKGLVTEESLATCYETMRNELGVEINFFCCGHLPEDKCYCRMPLVGHGAFVTEHYHLNPTETIFVGDTEADFEFAHKCSFIDKTSTEFFNEAR